MSGAIFVLSAASGTGKTSLARALLEKTDNLKLSVSYTTRARREKERHTENYHFVSREEFMRMRDQGEFIEHAEVFQNYYGTSGKKIDEMLNQEYDVLLEIDWQGAAQIKKHYPHAVMIFVLPPDTQTLQSRLEKRGLDAPDVIATRLKKALSEMRQYVRFDYLVVNEDFETALEELISIVRSCKLQRPYQQQKLEKLLTKLGLPKSPK